MEYREIVSVTGIGGLYQLLSTKSDGAIVRNLADKSTKFISARLHNVTPLESIEIYTLGNNVRLHEVLDSMKKSETSLPDTKKASNDDIKTYFKTVFPEIDEDRVYVSDMKKMLKWYDLLKTNDLLDFSSLQKQEIVEGGEEAAEAEAQVAEHKKGEDVTDVALVEDEKPAKKAAKKKAAVTEGEEGAEKPAKKAAAKKKKEETTEDEEGAEKPAKKAAAKKKKED